MISQKIGQFIPAGIRDTVFLRAFAMMKIPLLFFISPSVVEMTDERCVVKVRLNRRTKNHLKSMYFGVLAAGADCAGGLAAMRQIQAEGGRIDLIFKDFKAEFMKRAEGDVLFTCVQGKEILELVRKADLTGERENMTVEILATVPSKFADEPIARMLLTLSLKRRKS